MSQSGPDLSAPSVAYDKRNDNVYVIGTVGNAWGGPLEGTNLSLLQDDTNAPMVTKDVNVGGTVLAERSYKQTLIAQTTSNYKGEFQFTNLKPGGYWLQADHDGYWVRSTGVWVARDNLTKLSRVYLFPKNETHPCG